MDRGFNLYGFANEVLEASSTLGFRGDSDGGVFSFDGNDDFFLFGVVGLEGAFRGRGLTTASLSGSSESENGEDLRVFFMLCFGVNR